LLHLPRQNLLHRKVRCVLVKPSSLRMPSSLDPIWGLFFITHSPFCGALPSRHFSRREKRK
jgi:hypothetical protein